MRCAAAVLGLLGVLGTASCASLDAPAADPSDDGRADDSEVDDPADGGPRARIDGWTIELDGPDGPVPVAAVSPAEGTPVHVAARPGDGPTATLLVVVRSAVVPGPRYVLRYLDVDLAALDADRAGSPPELWWLPWRLQIDAEHGAGLDTAPRPVWSPDGSTVAWVEWDPDGTVLRLLDWSDDGPTATTSTPLEQVPPGLSLQAWQQAEDGQDVLLGELDGEPIRLELQLAAGGNRSA